MRKTTSIRLGYISSLGVGPGAEKDMLFGKINFAYRDNTRITYFLITLSKSQSSC